VYRASDGYLLQYRHWSAAGSAPRARIVALHGIQSHSGWYTYSSRRLAEAGYEVFFLDRRGAGLNRCSRGHALHSERLINDVVQFLTRLHRQQDSEQRRPIVLLGVSWGGKLAAAVAQRHPQLLSAIALLYPGIFSKMQPRQRDLWKLRFIEAIGWGMGHVPIPLNDPQLFTSDPQWQEHIRRDELALLTATVSFLLSSQKLTELVTVSREHERPASCNLPALLMLAGRDDVIDNAQTRAWFERWAGPSRMLIEYPNARHTLEFESDRDRFIDDLIAWLADVEASQPVEKGVWLRAEPQNPLEK